MLFTFFTKQAKLVFPEACTIKPLTAVIYGFSQKAKVFVPGKPFHHSLMSVGKARVLP